MPSAPQKRDWAKGRSLEMQRILVPSNWAASLLNCRTDWAQVPVSMLGNILRTNFCPLKSERDTVERSFFTKVNPGAWEPGSGSFPMVFIGFPFKVTVAMTSYFVQAPKILKKNGLVGGGNALLIKWCDKSKWGGFHGSPSIVIIPLKPNGPLEVAYFYFTNCLILILKAAKIRVMIGLSQLKMAYTKYSPTPTPSTPL